MSGSWFGNLVSRLGGAAPGGFAGGGGPMGRGMNPGIAGGMTEPDLMGGGYDALNEFVKSNFGFELPKPKTNILFPEPTQGNFSGQHPTATRAIENALLGASLTQSGNTVGENISNIARGVLGVGPTRDAMRMGPMNQALGMAQDISALKRMTAMTDEAKAQADMARAHTAYYDALAKNPQLGQGNHPRYSKTAWTPDPNNPLQENYMGLNRVSGQMEQVTMPDPEDPENSVIPMTRPREGKTLPERAALREMQADADKGKVWTNDQYNKRIDYWASRLTVNPAAAKQAALGQVPEKSKLDYEAGRGVLQQEYKQLTDDPIMGPMTWLIGKNQGQPPGSKQYTLDDARARIEELKGQLAQGYTGNAQTSVPAQGAPQGAANQQATPKAPRGRAPAGNSARRQLSQSDFDSIVSEAGGNMSNARAIAKKRGFTHGPSGKPIL